MKILKNAGHSKILAIQPGYLKPQHIMEKSGRTCYQSYKGKITDETSSKFVRMIMNRGHYSVIEHGWIGFNIRNYLKDFNPYRYFWPYTKFLFITERKNNGYLISGNMETWRKIYKAGSLEKSNLAFHLTRYCPNVFSLITPNVRDDGPKAFNGSPIKNIKQLETKEEILNHVALTVQFNNICRGFTHELVRHRVPVYSQESTRYVDESNLKVVVPPHKNEEEEIIEMEIVNRPVKASLSEWLELNEAAYRSLIKRGWKSEDARQVLPIATKAQIVTSCNLWEWHYIFEKRTARPAHWEIRRVMCNLLARLKKMDDCASVFDDFVLDGKDEKGVPCYKLVV